MELVRKFEERLGVLGHSSLIKEATKFSRELGLELSLTYPTPMYCTEEGEVVRVKDQTKAKKRTAEEIERSGIRPGLAGKVDSFSMGGRTRRLWYRGCPTIP